ncbi:MAG: hypothetical protein ACRC41_11825 [Sarcina sp.]
MDNYQTLTIKRSNQFLHTLAKMTIIIDNDTINENNIKLSPGEIESIKQKQILFIYKKPIE